MAPQTRIPTPAVVLGALGTVFWCIQLIPQIWQNWRRKKTEGVPGVMMMIWAISMDKLPSPIKCQHALFIYHLQARFRSAVMQSFRYASREAVLLVRTMTQETIQNFNVPLQIQPQIFGALSLAIWTQILVYSR